MHFSIISIAILVSCSTTYGFAVPPPVERSDSKFQPARPLKQFFIRVYNALNPTTTPEPPPKSTTERKPSPYLTQPVLHDIPNFVDYSTFLLGSFAANNTAIRFSYMNPNETGASRLQSNETGASKLLGNETGVPKLRGNYSVISFIVPQEELDSKMKGIFSNFLGSLKLPWTRAPPPDTNYSQFPPLIEYFTQRIQAYFSVYKYSDESRFNNTIVVFADALDADGSNPALNDDGYETTTAAMDSQDEETTTDDNQVETTSYLHHNTSADASHESSEEAKLE